MNELDLVAVGTPNRSVVRVRTSAWSDKTGLHLKKSVLFLRRKTTGINLLEEDVYAAGAIDIVPKIINLSTCADGLYEVVTCNERRDWESGYVEEYDYRLEPYT